MRNKILISLTCLASLMVVANASAQQAANYNSAEEINHDLTLLLLDKNINDVTKQLDNETSPTVASLFRRLVIYSRAGHASQVRTTLEQLAATPNWQCPARNDLVWLIRNASEQSFVTQRFYYERLCPETVEGAEVFVRLWSNVGDLKELDTWLSERSDRNDQWLMLRVQVRARSGTAGELLDALAAEIRAIRLTGQWQTAEKFLFAHLDSFWRVLPHTLAEIAIAAAQANAIDDAMRLWRMSSNIDRRNLDPLAQLAQTKLKPQLFAMYSQIKKEDPLSTIPDLALEMLH